MGYPPQGAAAGGLTRLSELEIDVDKDWLAFGVDNIAELVSGMAKGDLPVRDTNMITKITPGSIGTHLTTQGAGALPTWS